VLNAKDENRVKLGTVEEHENKDISLHEFEWQDMRQNLNKEQMGKQHNSL
jgi:hypothetical protein